MQSKSRKAPSKKEGCKNKSAVLINSTKQLRRNSEDVSENVFMQDLQKTANLFSKWELKMQCSIRSLRLAQKFARNITQEECRTLTESTMQTNKHTTHTCRDIPSILIMGFALWKSANNLSPYSFAHFSELWSGLPSACAIWPTDPFNVILASPWFLKMIHSLLDSS